MGAVSYSSIIVTIFSYVQRLGVTSNLPGIKIPESIQNVLIVCVNFFNTIEAAFPDVPDFDFRSQLVLLAVGVPVLLDIIFVWFISPFYDVVLHVLDLLGVGCFFYCIVTGIIIGFDSVTITWSVVSLIYIISRIVLIIYNRNKSTDELFDLVKNICTFFMSYIIPQSEKQISFRELKAKIAKFSKLIEIVPEKTVYWKSLILLIFSLILIIGGFACLGLFFDPGQIPDIVRLILPIFLFPLGFIFWINFMLKMFSWGRKFIVLLKQFIKRWGLRILMLVLDILYTPIIQCLVYHMTPSYQGCQEGFYLFYKRTGEDLFDPFINKTVECLPCARQLTGVCVEMCSGEKQLRMKSSPALVFTEDVFQIMGGVIIYTFVIVMIGIPLIWYFLVKRNSGFVKHINVYGSTSQVKWMALTNRMHTTGIFIFEDFKMERCYWCVFLLIMKLIQMLIEVMSEVVYEPLVILLPIYYLFSVVITSYFRPYIHLFNNLFEIILEVVNFIFSIVAVASYYGFEIPDSWTIPLSVLLLGLPIVSLFFLLCFDDDKGTKNDEADPTFYHKKKKNDKKKDKVDIPEVIQNLHNNDMEELLLNNHNASESYVHNPPSGGFVYGKADPTTPNISETGNNISSRTTTVNPGEGEVLESPHWEYADCDEEHCIIEEGLLDTIYEAMEREKDKEKIAPEEQTQALIAFEVRRSRIAKLMTKMYKTLDVVLDGSTIELLTRLLDTVVLFGAAATGWYLGALLAHQQEAVDIICG